ncbi:MAG TPA: TolC family protein [Fimbriimonas sp.]
MRYPLLSAALGCLPVLCSAQETLSLDEALRLAKEHNGTIRSAQMAVRIAGSQVKRAEASFYPSVTPRYRWNSTRTESSTSPGNQSDETSSSFLEASWRILDSGERSLTWRGAKKGLEAERFAALQTLRETLFGVHRQYYDTLRADELQKVAKARHDRAKLILKQTIARVELGDAPAKDILQAEADALNAEVQVVEGETQKSNASANLKAMIGLPPEKRLPELVAMKEPPAGPPLAPFEVVSEQGVGNRPDLVARRLGLESTDFAWRRQRREASWTFGLDGVMDHQFTPDRIQDRKLNFVASYPLFDGGALREIARETEYRLAAGREDLVQAERQALAEIEGAYAEVKQNRTRLTAARKAEEAALKNYNAAVEAQRLGAGDLVEVLTAQVSLVTAESNAIEALYDLLISDVRLALVTGEPLRGE